MTHHSNGAADSGPPSLFGGIAEADTPGNSISILSAVTGKEVPRTSMRKKKSPLKASILFLLLLTTGVLGFNFWQYNENAFAPKLAASQSKPSIAAPTKLVPTPSSPFPDGSRVPTKTTNASDIAVVETVKPAPTLASIAPPRQPEPKKKLLSARPSGSAANPPKSQAKRATTLSNAPIKKKSAAQTNKTSSSVKTASARVSDAKEAPSKPKKVSVTKAGDDPDEKLLEGMLRLMKRENAKDTSNMSSAK